MNLVAVRSGASDLVAPESSNNALTKGVLTTPPLLMGSVPFSRVVNNAYIAAGVLPQAFFMAFGFDWPLVLLGWVDLLFTRTVPTADHGMSSGLLQQRRCCRGLGELFLGGRISSEALVIPSPAGKAGFHV